MKQAAEAEYPYFNHPATDERVDVARSAFVKGGQFVKDSITEDMLREFAEKCRQYPNEPVLNLWEMVAGAEWMASAAPVGEAPKLDYPAAARAIALWLKPYCNEDLAYPDMIAQAAREVAAECERLKGEREALKEWIEKRIRVIDSFIQHSQDVQEKLHLSSKMVGYREVLNKFISLPKPSSNA
jgi:hypothetical protein